MWINSMDQRFAEGGYVDRPSRMGGALIGEGGEGQHVIPESKLVSCDV